MKKIKVLFLLATVIMLALTGCGKSNKPVKSGTGEIMTGFGVITTASGSAEPSDKDGLAQVDCTFAAVIVDGEGKIIKCVIDAVQAKVDFTKEGKIVTPLDTKFETKNEIKTGYGMGVVSKIGTEWYEQAAAFSEFVEGKTQQQIKGIAVNEKGAPTGAELSSSVTIAVGDFKDVVIKAMENSKALGGKSGDKIGIGATTTIDKSKEADDKEGLVQVYSEFAAATFDADDKVSSCIIDSVQADVKFNAEGKITSDTKAQFKTKNELGSQYGMAKSSSIGKEWFEQADSFAKYVTGKSIGDVSGISLSETGVPTDSELSASVTVSIGSYVEGLKKAAATSK